MNACVPTAISRIIEERGLKHCIIAEKAGYTPQMLCDMLNGRRIIKPIDIANLAKALDVSPNALFSPDRSA